jgi:uncharacterized protein YbcC (UPF0753/DUF2309 family)
MPLLNPSRNSKGSSQKHPHATKCCNTPTSDATAGARYAVDVVQAKLAPVWPLQDYVAVNPYSGFADHGLLTARGVFRSVSNMELMMPADYYRQQFANGTISKSDIDAAVDELVADGIAGAERINVNQILSYLKQPVEPKSPADPQNQDSATCSRPLSTFVTKFDEHNQSDWSREIGDEISKHCSSHYDQGQAYWQSASRGLPLFEAWIRAAKHDRHVEFLGLSGFRHLVSQLPTEPHAALAVLLDRLQVPPGLQADYLLCEALATPGWCAWAKYQSQEASKLGKECSDFAAVLAMRLAYEVALSEQFDFHLHWPSIVEQHETLADQLGKHSDEDLIHYTMLKASEIAFRNQLIADLAAQDSGVHKVGEHSPLAQMVFCIDVRSERIRRHLEATSSRIETLGFAGFFGIPMEFVELGGTQGTAQVPVLISPRITVREELDALPRWRHRMIAQRRWQCRYVRKSWKSFQESVLSTFAFVETMGLLYGFKLVARTLGLNTESPGQFDAVRPVDHERLGPSLRGLAKQGIDRVKQADLAESLLRGIGIVDHFAKLVVFCGHACQTDNNPLKAGLDCGACGGHSGESNARFAAKLLNQQHVRTELAKRGIQVPEATQFVAALHNTTTDRVTFFDTHLLPVSHQKQVEQLDALVRAASERTATERLSTLPGPDAHDLVRRSRDWSEVRPEWGLAGNATFIAAPRDFTKTVALEGRAFLHSYDHARDHDWTGLEQIMTAPLVVANWINMQYYASTVDPQYFGSGSKTVHNVVGRFGVLSGNGGDLMTGLPWQSVHNGVDFQHQPLRLLAMIVASREAVEAVTAKHEHLAALVSNGWIQLVVVEEGSYFRYTGRQQWEEIASCPMEHLPACF